MVEDDFLKIIRNIHVNDEQLNVYSIPLADVILRSAVYIESISKELYEKVTGQQLDDKGKKKIKFDAVCLKRINDEWELENKEIYIISPNLFLTDEKRLLSPLQNAHKTVAQGGAVWNDAYQSLKHDQIANIKKATIDNALSILGALYILCVYYSLVDSENQKLSLFDARCGSKLFSAQTKTAVFRGVGWSFKSGYQLNLTDEELKKAIFLIKFPDKEINKLFDSYKESYIYSYVNLSKNKEIQQYIKSHPDEIKNIKPNTPDMIILHVSEKLKKPELKELMSINCPSNHEIKVFANFTLSDFQLRMQGIEKEVKLNTEGTVYPEYTFTNHEIKEMAEKRMENLSFK